VISVSARVSPGASRDSVAVSGDGSLEVRLKARPIEGKANAALVALLAARLGLRRSQIRIARGQRLGRKLLEVELASVDELRQRLERAS